MVLRMNYGCVSMCSSFQFQMNTKESVIYQEPEIGSEIGSRFGEPGSTPPGTISQSSVSTKCLSWIGMP